MVLAAALVVLAATPARPETSPPGEIDVSINYVYAAQLGFGGYRLDGLTANVYSLPLAFTLRNFVNGWQLKLGLPIQYGDYSFSKTIGDFKVKASTNTVAATPTLRLLIPIRPWWNFSLLGAWGFGTTFSTSGRVTQPSAPRTKIDSGESAFYTYEIGAGSLIQQPVRSFTLSLGNAFYYAGNASMDHDPSVQAYGILETGVAASHSLGFELGRVVPETSLFFIHYYFTPSLEFARAGRANLEVTNQFEVGLSFGSSRSLDLPYMPFLDDLQVGGSYRFGSGLDGFRVNFGFPF
jgi:hypothetical protein